MGFVVLNINIRLSKMVVQNFSKMVDAARKDGVSHFLISSGLRGVLKDKKTL